MKITPDNVEIGYAMLDGTTRDELIDIAQELSLHLQVEPLRELPVVTFSKKGEEIYLSAHQCRFLGFENTNPEESQVIKFTEEYIEVIYNDSTRQEE